MWTIFGLLFLTLIGAISHSSLTCSWYYTKLCNLSLSSSERTTSTKDIDKSAANEFLTVESFARGVSIYLSSPSTMTTKNIFFRSIFWSKRNADEYISAGRCRCFAAKTKNNERENRKQKTIAVDTLLVYNSSDESQAININNGNRTNKIILSLFIRNGNVFLFPQFCSCSFDTSFSIDSDEEDAPKNEKIHINFYSL